MKRIALGAVAVLGLIGDVGLASRAAGADAPRVQSFVVEVSSETGAPVAVDDPEKIEIFDDEGVLPIVGATVGKEWQITILIDRRLSESRIVRNAATDLSEMAEDLVGLGSVEIFLAGDDFTRSMVPSRDPEELRQALAWLRIREGGEAAQLEVRRTFVRDFRIEELAQTRYAAVSATADQRLAELRFGLQQAMQTETRIVEEQRRLLLEWALENRRESPALLLIVSGGDDDSFAYYESLLEAAGVSEAIEDLDAPAPEPSREDLGRALASLGWVTVTYSPGLAGQGIGSDRARRPAEESVETVVQDGQIVDRTVFTPRFDPRDLFRRRQEGEESDFANPRLLAPLETGMAVADATGGDVVLDREGLSQVLARLAGRLHLRVADSSSSYAPREVRARFAPGFGKGLAPPRTRRWVSAGTPELLAEIRASRLLEEGVEEGPLLVTAQSFERDGSRLLAVEIESMESGMEASDVGPLRLTFGTLTAAEEGTFVHSLVLPGSTTRVTERGSLTLETALPFAPAPGRPVVVLVEDLASGRWGGTYATALSAVGDELQMALSGITPRAIYLLEPEEEMVTGPTLFETIHDQEVARVEFFLDGEPAGERQTPPFALRIDLGRLPEPHWIEVVGFDSEGRELGRDRLTVNESGGVFRVRIVQPRGPEGEADRLVGPIAVEARVEAPRTAVVERVEFFWNESLVATRYAPPFVQVVPVPESEPRGYFRVVAHLEDGASAEDVLFVNSPGGSERVKVDLIQLYAVVTGRDGRPIQGLGLEDFRVLEGGIEQEIANFGEAKDQPLTVGLAIDTSASMFVKLPRVQRAAGRFIDGLDSEKDRAFLVDFGTDPRLFHDTSRDLESVGSALRRLEPAGQTAIWKGISFALVQLQGLQGKKALIVFSDGADEDPDFSFRTCLKFAQRVGVPIYVIVSNDEIYRTGGRGLNVRGFINRLESLTRAVGGRVYFSRVGEDLEEIYAQIDDELRSQYLLGYYARDEGEGRWRSVRVEVDQPGARARTVAGYFR